MKSSKISDIAEIQGGVYVRSRKGKDLSLLNANNFDERGILKDELIPSLTLRDCPPQHVLQENDILLVTKGSRFLASIYKSIYGPCVASTAFLVLRVKEKNIIPDYLAILMNEALHSSYFKNRTRGTSLPSIQRRDVAEYRISIPSIEKQQTIIEIFNEHKLQTKIYNNLTEKKHSLIHSIILSSS